MTTQGVRSVVRRPHVWAIALFGVGGLALAGTWPVVPLRGQTVTLWQYLTGTGAAGNGSPDGTSPPLRIIPDEPAAPTAQPNSSAPVRLIPDDGLSLDLVKKPLGDETVAAPEPSQPATARKPIPDTNLIIPDTPFEEAPPSAGASPIRKVGLEEEETSPFEVANKPGTRTSDKPKPIAGGAVPSPIPTAAVKPLAAAAPSGAIEKLRAEPLMELSEIEALIARNELLPALREISKHYWAKPDERATLKARIDPLAQQIYFSPQPHVYEPYVVQANDQLRLIAQKYKLPWEYLARINRVDPRTMRYGQKLKVIAGPFSAIVFCGRYEMVVHHEGVVVRTYRVGLGKDGSTPVGVFSVKNKMVDPTYYGPNGLVIKSSDPKNPLGERWIDIGDGYGIHGTIEPQSIGKSESRGCVRMLNEDVEEVYDLIGSASEIRIER